MASTDIDSSRAWFVAISAHVCIMIHEGLTKSLGVMIPEITEDFNTYTWVIGLVISLMTTVGSITSLLAGSLSEKFSTRSIVMACGILATLGVVIAFRITTTVAGFGVVLITFTGVSLRLTFVMSTSILGEYFNKYYASANSLALLGASTGVMTFAPLAQYLVITYGWRGALLILGGICGHIVVCGAAMKKVSSKKEHTKKVRGLEDGNEFTFSDTDSNTNAQEPVVKVNKNIDRFGLRLFRTSKFPVLLAAAFADLYVWTGWVVYLVPHAKDKGLPSYSATSLATAGGIGNLLGKIAIPLLIDKKLLRARTALVLGLVLSGIALLVDPFVTDYAGLLVITSFFGFTNGTNILAIFILVKEIAGPLNLAKAMPWIFVTSGVARMMAGFFIGWMFEVTGNYDVSWMVLGSVSLIGAVIVVLESIVKRYA